MQIQVRGSDPAPPYTVAVRELCEFAAKTGDLDLRFTPAPSAEEGMRGHRTVAARRGAGHRAEVRVAGVFQGLQVRGRIAPAPGRLYDFDGAASGVIRQNLDLTAFALETGLQLRPLSLVQEEATPALNDGLLRQWPRPAAGVDKHRGYAFQWFALATLILGLYVWFQLIRPRR